MGKSPAFQLYVKDWLTDIDLQLTKGSTRCGWMNLLCHMLNVPEKGKLEKSFEDLAKLAGLTDDEMKQFFIDAEHHRFCDFQIEGIERNAKITHSDGVTLALRVTLCHKKITLINRRMFREQKTRVLNKLRQRKHRAKRRGHANVTAPSPIPSPRKRKRGARNSKVTRPDEPPKYKSAEQVLKEKGLPIN